MLIIAWLDWASGPIPLYLYIVFLPKRAASCNSVSGLACEEINADSCGWGEEKAVKIQCMEGASSFFFHIYFSIEYHASHHHWNQSSLSKSSWRSDLVQQERQNTVRGGKNTEYSTLSCITLHTEETRNSLLINSFHVVVFSLPPVEVVFRWTWRIWSSLPVHMVGNISDKVITFVIAW